MSSYWDQWLKQTSLRNYRDLIWNSHMWDYCFFFSQKKTLISNYCSMLSRRSIGYIKISHLSFISLKTNNSFVKQTPTKLTLHQLSGIAWTLHYTKPLYSKHASTNTEECKHKTSEWEDRIKHTVSIMLHRSFVNLWSVCQWQWCFIKI